MVRNGSPSAQVFIHLDIIGQEIRKGTPLEKDTIFSRGLHDLLRIRARNDVLHYKRRVAITFEFRIFTLRKILEETAWLPCARESLNGILKPYVQLSQNENGAEKLRSGEGKCSEMTNGTPKVKIV